MYPISKEALDLFIKGYRQTAEITLNGTQESLKLTGADIVQGGLSVNRYSVTGSRIEVGSAIASELAIILDNRDDKFSGVVFEGAELFVRIGIRKWDACRWENAQTHYIPLGYFTVDESPRKLARITLRALDRMVHFDKAVDWTLLTFPMTAGQLLEKICSLCNVTLGMSTSELLNHGYIIESSPAKEGATYRQILSWIAELTGCCAFIDWRGQLMLKWYEPTDVSITPSDRYTSDLYERGITITGAAVSADDEIYLAGSDEYAVSIEDNPLIQHDHEAVAANLYAKLGGFNYTPFSAEIKHYPQIYPLDIIGFVDRSGVSHQTIVTDVTFTLNANTVIEGKGETATTNGYAAQDPLTEREQGIIERLKREQNRQLESREQALLSLNETIWNSLGLRVTEFPDGAGGRVYYYHDGENLENSTVIYTFCSGGFAWTDEWQGEDTVWQYGFTRDGNAVMNILSAYKIQAEQLEAGSVTAEKLSVEYRRSVEDDINAGMDEVRQDFEVGFGTLRSEITSNIAEERTRAQQAEQSLSDGLDGLSDDIDTVETTLTSKIEQTAENVLITVGEGYVSKDGLGAALDSGGYLDDYVTVSALNIKSSEIIATVRSGSNDGFYYRLTDNEFTVGQLGSGSAEIPALAISRYGTNIQNAYLGACTIGGDCTINGTLTTNQIHSTQVTDQYGRNYWGSLTFTTPYVGENYEILPSYTFQSGGETSRSSVQIEAGGQLSLYASSSMSLYAVNFGQLLGNWVNGSGQSIVSDPDCKNSITDISDSYEALFDRLRPVTYKYNDGTSGRKHTGFIATEIQAAIAESGLTEQDFAGVCTLPFRHPASASGKEETVCIRYDELIALNTWQIQRLKAEVAELKDHITAQSPSCG